MKYQFMKTTVAEALLIFSVSKSSSQTSKVITEEEANKKIKAGKKAPILRKHLPAILVSAQLDRLEA